MTDHDSSLKRHPIQVVARRTGLTVDLLRAWEKRYGVVEPGRSGGGRRLYSDDDIERLRLLRRAVVAGRRISAVASLGNEQLARLVEEDEHERTKAIPQPSEAELASAADLLAAGLAATERLDAQELERVLNRAMVTLSSPVLIEHVIAPFMRRLGELWRHGSVTPANEHLASAVVARVLGRVIEAAEPAETSLNLVVATPSGAGHEFGALFAAVTAASEGWRVIYLGRDLPAEDIAAAANHTGAEAVALSLVFPSADKEIEMELKEMRRRLAADTPIIVGGAAAESYARTLEEIGARRTAGIEDLPEILAHLS
jgi:DNA-binding transcriptional MerR regulator/methylmalonyl-CoA mutase cobalamin-binding subunit